MPHFDVRKYKEIEWSVRFTTREGRTYKIVPVSDQMLKQIDAIAAMSLSRGEIQNARLAIFTGSEASEFSRMDYREKTVILRYIADMIGVARFN